MGQMVIEDHRICAILRITISSWRLGKDYIHSIYSDCPLDYRGNTKVFTFCLYTNGNSIVILYIPVVLASVF